MLITELHITRSTATRHTELWELTVPKAQTQELAPLHVTTLRLTPPEITSLSNPQQPSPRTISHPGLHMLGVMVNM